MMCKSIPNGGKRCAGHTREPYQIAVNAVFRATRKPQDLKALLEKATAYAMTAEGDAKVRDDLARNANKIEFSKTLKKALAQAQKAKEVEVDVKKAIDNASGKSPKPSSKDGVAPEPLSWSASEPIWPNREATNRATAGLGKTPQETLLIQKAYRSLFKDAWRAFFFMGGKFPEPPQSNDEGWDWRKQATEFANKRIAGAQIVTAQDLHRGMTVYNSKGVYTVRNVHLVKGDVSNPPKYVFDYYNNPGFYEGEVESTQEFVLIPEGESFKPR